MPYVPVGIKETKKKKKIKLNKCTFYFEDSNQQTSFFERVVSRTNCRKTLYLAFSSYIYNGYPPLNCFLVLSLTCVLQKKNLTEHVLYARTSTNDSMYYFILKYVKPVSLILRTYMSICCFLLLK